MTQTCSWGFTGHHTFNVHTHVKRGIKPMLCSFLLSAGVQRYLFRQSGQLEHNSTEYSRKIPVIEATKAEFLQEFFPQRAQCKKQPWCPGYTLPTGAELISYPWQWLHTDVGMQRPEGGWARRLHWILQMLSLCYPISAISAIPHFKEQLPPKVPVRIWDVFC